jgi:5-methylcytosine-specific restriction endonuclease McrA
MNGICLKKKGICALCGSDGRVRSGYYYSKKEVRHIFYTYEGKEICTKCSKARKVI